MRRSLLWGCHLDEYRRMFGLADADLGLRLLEYGCGVSAFNAELQLTNSSVISGNTLFSLNDSQIRPIVLARFDDLVREVSDQSEQYDMNDEGGIDLWIKNRRAGLDQFFADYALGLKQGRYIPFDDPHLSFDDFSFDLALSAYDLFSGDTTQTLEFHLQHLRELTRVAKEVRVFPLVDNLGQPSALLGPVLLSLQHENYGVEIREVEDTLLRRGHAMLRVWARECRV